ncbi:MAG: DNA polymerase III subunit gamma/tau [Campylobacterales bacterium]|nr:DNA polymerase III subunit gamma/tau [Campylobacterales bacterium]
MSIALARKYRPSSFDALIGQESVSQTLSQALDSHRLSHAYLFSGLRGSGKTSTARIFAKALLCEVGESAHPCDKCPNCEMANEGRHIDIIEMDAASNRGIDDIKELIEHTKYKPSVGRYKIFIIDEIHMLTTQAFNALLKTLEEPPDFVKFILATTDPLKLPATILSRTQHFRFKKIPQQLVKKHLAHILNLEQVEFEDEALEIIARSGEGSLRDSLTLLDQAIVYSKNYVDLSTVVGMLGIIDPNVIENLLNDIYAQDEAKVIAFINQNREYEAQMILDELTLYLKELLLSGNKKFTPLIIDRFFRALTQSKKLFDMGADGEFILSLTLFKMMEAMRIKDIDTMIKSLENELQGVRVAKPTQEAVVEAKEETPIPKSQPTPPIDQGAILFKKLIEKIYDRNYGLGEVFENNIEYATYEHETLTWNSMASDEDKKLLISQWGLIKTFVQEIFGIQTTIKSNTKPKPPKDSEPQAQPPQEEPPLPSPSDEETGSMIEDIEMKSSCISPEHNSSNEIEPSQILQEPMVKESIKLFEPSKVRVRKKV